MSALDHPMETATVVDPDQLTSRQQARRRRVLDVAVERASRGGYCAVQIREVAQEADVALGTVYRYFSSKDHLLASCLVDSTRALEATANAGRLGGDGPPAEQLVELIRSALQTMWAAPEATRAMVTALNSSAAGVSTCKERLSASMSRIMRTAFVDEAVDWRESERRTQAIRTIEHVWFSTLLAWVNGWMTSDEVEEELGNAIRLVVG